MKNRWYHKPILHTGHHPAKKVSWIELFFDLIFVAAFIQLGDALSSNIGFVGFLKFAGSFLPLWVIWTAFSYFLNRYNLDDFIQRVMVFLLMFSVGAMVIGSASILDNTIDDFAIPTSCALIIIAIMYLRAYFEEPASKEYSLYWGGVIALSALLWAMSCLVPVHVAYVFWGAATLVVLLAPLNTVSRKIAARFTTDSEHLAERFGLLTLIVLGESFVKVLSELSKNGLNLHSFLQTCMVLLITCSLWWIYFDEIAESKVKQGNFKPFIWLYSHFTLQLGITGTGVALKKAIFFEMNSPVPVKYRWLLCGMIAIVFASVSLIDGVIDRKNTQLSDRVRINFRSLSTLFILLLIPASTAMPGWLFLAFIVLIVISQVIFDMIVAPFEISHHDHEKTTSQIINDNPEYARTIKRFDPTKSIMKGAPSEFKKDIYYFLVEGSWAKVGLSIVFLFVIFNVIFASLYLLDPMAVSGTRANNFLDAFSYSVQTMSTIGFGTMSPNSDYGHIVMIIQAAFSIIFIALFTGLTFAKASKPKASFLFSKNLLINKHDGKDVLTIRSANAVGSEVVDASVSMHVLKDYKTAEGHHMRKFYELPLARSTSPVFTLSWSIYHEIDKESQIYQMLKTKDPYSIFSIIVTLNGYDTVYGQNVHSRKIYYPEDILFDCYFEDIIHQSAEGQILMDYDKFHKIAN